MAQEKALDLTNWHECLKCLRSAGFRSRKMLTSDNAVLFSYSMWLIGRVDFGLDVKSLRSAISRWFFMAHTTGRYTSSPESQFESDIGRISDLAPGDGPAFLAELDRLVGANFTRDYWAISLPNRLDTSSPRSPALCAYLAALNLLDAEVLFSEVRVEDLLDPAATAPRSIERHHLFPKNYLSTLGVTGTRQVNAIANMAFLDWPENQGSQHVVDGLGGHGPQVLGHHGPDRLGIGVRPPSQGAQYGQAGPGYPQVGGAQDVDFSGAAGRIVRGVFHLHENRIGPTLESI